MFTSVNTRSASVYKRVAVETGVQAADSHRLVGLLFDGLLQAVAAARGAMERGDLVAKGEQIGKAVRIIEEGLKPGLDKQDGGDLAQNLEGLYGYCTMRLALANARNDESIVEEVGRLMAEIASAWKDIKSDTPAAPTGV